MSLSSPSSITDIVVLKTTMMAFKGAVEERDRDGKKSQALYAFPPEASIRHTFWVIFKLIDFMNCTFRSLEPIFPKVCRRSWKMRGT